MKYLIDSNTFITAKNDFYPFERVPNFWVWLAKCGDDGILCACSKIRKELLNGEGDNLRNWAKANGEFFVSEDASTARSISLIAAWVQANKQFDDAAKQEFFKGGDLTLIAHAHAHNLTIVTFEKDAPAAKAKIHIPNVAKHFGVRSINLYQLLDELKPTF